METSRSRRRSGPEVEIQYENVFFRIITGTVCNIVFGVIVTITGIVVTSTTFHDFSSASRIYLAGPILIAAGCLCLTRAVINKAKERNLRQSSLRRRRRRRRTDSEVSSCLISSPYTRGISILVFSSLSNSYS